MPEWSLEARIREWRQSFKSVGEREDVAPYVGKRKMNLGCGALLEPTWKGWINADINPKSAAQVLFDARCPFPFADGTFDTIQAFDFLHHFSGDTLFRVVYNVGNALKVGGHLIGKVPRGCTGHPMQLSFWTEATPRLFDKRIYGSCSNMYTAGWDQGLPMHAWDVVAIGFDDALVKFIMRRA